MKKKHKKHSYLTPSDVELLGAGVRIKPVRCGKKKCHKCPHFIYVYQRIWQDGKMKEFYMGKLVAPPVGKGFGLDKK